MATDKGIQGISITYEEFVEYPVGGRVIDSDGTAYIKIEQSIPHHLEGMVVNLETGKLCHVSYLKCFKVGRTK